MKGPIKQAVEPRQGDRWRQSDGERQRRQRCQGEGPGCSRQGQKVREKDGILGLGDEMGTGSQRKGVQDFWR